MWLKNISKPFQTLTVRLILWNTVGFLAAAVVTWLVFDTRIRAFLNQRLDRQLETKLFEIKELQVANLDRDLFLSEIDHHSRAVGVDNIFYRLLDAEGKVVLTSDMASWKNAALDTLPLDIIVPETPYWETLPVTDKPYDARVINFRLRGGEITQVGFSTAERDLLLAQARAAMAGAMLLVFVLGSILTTLIAAKTLKGMRTISRNVVEIADAGVFSRPIPLPTGSTETDALARTFNRAFTKIEELMDGMEQVLGDIAHDMRSPVTRIRSAAESLLSEPNTTAREEDLAGHAIEECDRILSLVNTILEIKAAESEMARLINEELDLVSLIREGADLFRFMMEDKGHTLVLDLPQEAWFFGDKGYIQRILANLLDNAIKYTPDNGRVQLSLSQAGPWWRLAVEDTGIGVLQEEAELIFKRFYRSDKSRTHPGNGLGLTFCRAVAFAMGGQIFLEPKQEPGSRFVVLLPFMERTWQANPP